MRELHELLWHVSEALTMEPARSVHGELSVVRDEIRDLTGHDATVLAGLDRAAIGRRVNALLLRASHLVRGETPPKRDLTGKDLTGKDLRGRDMSGSLLLGARLIGADLSGANLLEADLRGADLRGANLAAADLSGSLFLTQPQVESARGDQATRLPASVECPSHWRV
jgi:uncharacterized protein YjbI with pentapeptide repeats